MLIQWLAMLLLSYVFGFAKTFLVTYHGQLIQKEILSSPVYFFQTGFVYLKHSREVKKEGNQVNLLMMQRLQNLQH